MNSACAGVRMIHHLSAHCEHWTLGETLHIWLFTPSLHHGASRIRFNKTHGTTSQQHNNGSVLFGVICESFAEFYVTRICSEYATRFFDDIFAYCNNGSVKSSYERRWIFFVLSKRGRFWSLVCQSGIRIFRTERRGENEDIHDKKGNHFIWCIRTFYTDIWTERKEWYCYCCMMVLLTRKKNCFPFAFHCSKLVFHFFFTFVSPDVLDLGWTKDRYLTHMGQTGWEIKHTGFDSLQFIRCVLSPAK